MQSFIEQAQFYAAYHQNPMTRYTHLIGVPLIILSLMILLGFINVVITGIFIISFATLATIALLIYYFRLHWQLALTLTPILLCLWWIGSLFSHNGPTKLGIWAFIITFIIGWALQLYGHFIEGKKPVFMVNIWQALLAPLFLTAELFFMAGFMKPLKEQIYGPVEFNNNLN
jgi:uncharacterized membrane protein YGL010W